VNASRISYELAKFGYRIDRSKKRKISIVRDPKAAKITYNDQVDKSDVLVGKTAYTLIANNVSVKASDKRAYRLTLTPNIPSFTTTTGKTLVPVEYLHLLSDDFYTGGGIAFVIPYPKKNEIRLHTLANDEVEWATDIYGHYWLADKYPDLAKRLLDSDQRKSLAAARRILDRVIRTGMGELEKEMAIYEHMVGFGRYDWNAYMEIIGSPLYPDEPPANPNAASLYGALVDGSAVCEGWSEAYHLLFLLSGIKSKTVIGKLRGELHQWVAVRIDGEWYHVESTTKNDPDSMYLRSFNFTYADANNFLGYDGGEEKAKSERFDYLNRNNRPRNPDKSPFEFEAEEAAEEAKRLGL